MEEGMDEDTVNKDDFMSLMKNLSNVKVSLKFNSLKKFIDYYERIRFLEFYLPFD